MWCFFSLSFCTFVYLFVLLGKGDVPLSYIVDQDNRTAWITDKVMLAKSQFMDGINIDIEQAVEEGSPEYYALTSLVKETTEMFHREIPGSQVKRNDWALGDNGHFPRPVSQFEIHTKPSFTSLHRTCLFFYIVTNTSSTIII